MMINSPRYFSQQVRVLNQGIKTIGSIRKPIIDNGVQIIEM